MKKYKYKFSVIIPVYKVEEYLRDTIESVINQTIGFEDNIEMILVNDGSPDNSEAICLEYQEKYPNNIVYIVQKNAGVSAARNNGIEHATGEYINFLDSDDTWELDVFTKVYKMFEENPDIDIIGVRQEFFEAQNGYPSLDYKFDSDKIVDIFNYYNHIQLSVTSGFVRSSAIGDVRFDTKVKYSEDGKFLTEIVFKKEKLGIIGSSIHNYRKRFSANSAIQTKNNKNDWYIQTVDDVYFYLIDLSIKKYGYVIPYVQTYIAYDYQWRFKEPIGEDITDEVLKEYKEKSYQLLQYVDDRIIAEQRNIYSEYKIEEFKFKYRRDISSELKYWNHQLYFNNLLLVNLENSNLLKLNNVLIKQDKLTLSGTFNAFLPEKDYKVYLVVNNSNRTVLDLEKSDLYPRKFLNQKFASNKTFKIDLNLEGLKQFYFELVYKEKYDTKILTNVEGTTNFTDFNYYIKDDKIFYYRDRTFYIDQNSASIRKRIKTKKCVKSKSLRIKNIIIRGLYKLLKPFKKKEIWLLSDRGYTANDNGYALFKYICENHKKDINAYFIITKGSADFAKVKSTGKYIIFNSLKYKVYFLLASKIISSQADDWVMNPYGRNLKNLKDLINSKFIFLQHGITKDDISPWLNQYEKNIDMFVAAAKPEYHSLLAKNYGFGKEIVKLTGFPRFDLLNNAREKVIAIMPTWRFKLGTAIDSKTGERKYNPSFKDSKYFKFYNNLINDERLLEAMKKHSYKGLFINHPSHELNTKDYTKNELFDIPQKSVNYSEVFKQAALLVTDYSSVAFDFAYLKKPVIYTQGDSKEFFAGQIYNKGYYSYEKDGFGPVLYNYEDTVKEIIKAIENDCQMESKYQKRVDSFYEYTDNNNSERVYDEITKL